MATYNILTDRTTSVVITGSQTVFIGQNAAMLGSISTSSATTARIDIQGTMSGGFISFNEVSGTGYVNIGVNGSYVSQSSSSFVIGISSSASTANIVVNNAGYLSGQNDTIFHRGTGDIEVTNSGIMQGPSSLSRRLIDGGGRVDLNNSGDISSSFVLTANAALEVINTGIINAISTALDANSTAEIVNSNAINSVNGFVILADGNLDVRNTGTLQSSQNTAINANANAQIINDGQIIGRNGIITNGALDLNNSGQILSEFIGIDVSQGARIFNSGDISAIDARAIAVNTAASLTVTNTGTIATLSTSSQDEAVYGRGNIDIYNTGIISGRNAIEQDGTGSVQIVNLGEILSENAAITADGGNAIRLVNSGTISNAFNSNVDLLDFVNATTLYVRNSGDIISGGDALYMQFAFGGDISNSGSIYARDIAIAGANIRAATTLVNSGSIEGGDYAIQLANVSGSDAFGHIVRNSGDLIGDVFLSNGGDLLVNTGAIEGDVELRGGDDIYRADADGTVVGTINLGDGANTAWGGDGNDIFLGGSGIDTIRAGGGDDEITGGDGDDVLFGKAGDDLILGGEGADRMLGDQGNDELIGGDGDDELFGGAGDDILNGEVGNDTLRGGDGQDLLQGFQGNDQLFGGFGDDVLEGGGGNDGLRGGQGDDFIWGAAGDDRIEGGAGIDTVQYTGAASNFTFELLSSGNIRVTDNVGNNGVDILSDVELVKFVGGGDPVDIMDLI